EVRVFARIHATGLEPDLALLFVYLLDAAHHPFAFRNLVLHLASHPVVKIEVVPAVALRHPDDLFPIANVAAILLARITEERLRFFADDGARFTRGRVNLDHAVDLMPAMVVFKRECAAVLAPFEPRQVVWIWKERVVHDDLLFGLDVEIHGLRLV